MPFSQNEFFVILQYKHLSLCSMYTKLSSYTLSSILKIFSEGFVNKSFLAWFMWHFNQKNMLKIYFLWLWTVYFDSLGNESIYPEIPLSFYFHLVCKQNEKEFCTWLYHMFRSIYRKYAKSCIFNEIMPNLHN